MVFSFLIIDVLAFLHLKWISSMKAYFFLSDPGYTEFEEKEQLYKINWTLLGFFSAD